MLEVGVASKLMIPNVTPLHFVKQAYIELGLGTYARTTAIENVTPKYNLEPAQVFRD